MKEGWRSNKVVGTANVEGGGAEENVQEEAKGNRDG